MTTPPEPELAERVARAEARRRRSARARRSNLWAYAARVGTLGWLVVLPILAGAALGHLLDRRLGTGVTFAAAFLVLGLGAAAYALWSELKKAL